MQPTRQEIAITTVAVFWRWLLRKLTEEIWGVKRARWGLEPQKRQTPWLLHIPIEGGLGQSVVWVANVHDLVHLLIVII
jgi:hypothetical protein